MSFAAMATARHDAVRWLKSSRFQVCCLIAQGLSAIEVAASHTVSLHFDFTITWLVLHSKLRNFLRLPE
jgi:hypothetical protein